MSCAWRMVEPVPERMLRTVWWWALMVRMELVASKTWGSDKLSAHSLLMASMMVELKIFTINLIFPGHRAAYHSMLFPLPAEFLIRNQHNATRIADIQMPCTQRNNLTVPIHVRNFSPSTNHFLVLMCHFCKAILWLGDESGGSSQFPICEWSLSPEEVSMNYQLRCHCLW